MAEQYRHGMTLAEICKEFLGLFEDENELTRLAKEHHVSAARLKAIAEVGLNGIGKERMFTVEIGGWSTLGLDLDAAFVADAKTRVDPTTDHFPEIRSRADIADVLRPFVEALSGRVVANALGMTQIHHIMYGRRLPGYGTTCRILKFVHEQRMANDGRTKHDAWVVEAKREVFGENNPLPRVHDLASFLAWMNDTVREAPDHHGSELGFRGDLLREWLRGEQKPTREKMIKYFRAVCFHRPQWLETPCVESRPDPVPTRAKPAKMPAAPPPPLPPPPPPSPAAPVAPEEEAGKPTDPRAELQLAAMAARHFARTLERAARALDENPAPRAALSASDTPGKIGRLLSGAETIGETIGGVPNQLTEQTGTDITDPWEDAHTAHLVTRIEEVTRALAVLLCTSPAVRARILPLIERYLRALTNLLVRMDDGNTSAAIELLQLQSQAWENVPPGTR